MADGGFPLSNQTPAQHSCSRNWWFPQEHFGKQKEYVITSFDKGLGWSFTHGDPQENLRDKGLRRKIKGSWVISILMSNPLEPMITLFPPKDSSHERLFPYLLSLLRVFLSFTSLEPPSFCHFFSIPSILSGYIFLLFAYSLPKLTFQTFLHLNIEIFPLTFWLFLIPSTIATGLLWGLGQLKAPRNLWAGWPYDLSSKSECFWQDMLSIINPGFGCKLRLSWANKKTIPLHGDEHYYFQGELII